MCIVNIMGEEDNSFPSGRSEENQSGTDVETIERIKVKKPQMYQVVLLNDDFTPMDFVVWLLKNLFHKPEEEAARIMLQVHHQGAGVCGVYPYDVARTKVYQAREAAKIRQHPLECLMEPAE